LTPKTIDGALEPVKPQVVVVGSYVQDLSFSCVRLPAPGESVVGRFVTGPGGKGSNQAVAAHRAGASVFFVGAVGRDAFAAEAKKFYRAEGLPARFVEKPRHPTAAASVLVDPTGQNQIAVSLSASVRLRPKEIDPALIRGARVVICQNEANDAVAAHVFRLARRAGVVTVLNPAPMRADFGLSLLDSVDVLIPNEAEFVALANLAPATAALLREAPYAGLGPFTEAALNALDGGDLHRLCRTLGVRTVIVTLGSRGSFVSRESAGEFIPAHRVKAVDTTGAGDAFVGGFAAGLVKFEGDILRAARFGNAASALAVTKLGTARVMPTEREILRLIKGSRADS
jgi:ribokinase